MIEISVQKAIKDAKREFADLSAYNIKRGVSNAINRTLSVGVTRAKREISKQYTIGPHIVLNHLKIYKANPRQPAIHGMIYSSGRPMPLMGFFPVRTKKGVMVKVKQERKFIRQAFIKRMPSGYVGVFARGKYVNGEFKFRNYRIKKSGSDLPLTELTTASVSGMLKNNTVLNHISDRINTYFPGRLTHELMRLRTSVGDGV
jgi:hypothetical protein